MREIIIRNIDNAPNGKEFFAGISGNFKDFGQTLCELIDNPISNFRAHGIHGRVEIVLEEQGDHVDVMVRDNGTGIENMDAALTIAARSCAESTLNEHGMGLKHALASINAGENQHWSIQTRTAEDVANDRYQRAEGPYDIHMPVSMIPGSGEVAGGTGTVVRVRCPMHKFLTLKPASKKEEPTFGQMAAYLRETLRYTYANLLRDKAFTILFTAVDKSGASDGGEIAGALEPNWRDGQMTELPPVETDLGGGPVTICCRYGSIRRSKENAFYYRANMASSGAEIRINGRASSTDCTTRSGERPCTPARTASSPRSTFSAIRRKPCPTPRRRKTACVRMMRRWRRCSAGSAPTSPNPSRRRVGSRCWCVCWRRKSRRNRASCGSLQRRTCISA